MAQTAKLFMNGRSQAVRLPKEFRFEGKEVEIRRDPATGGVVLTPEAAPVKSRRRSPVSLAKHNPSVPFTSRPGPGSREPVSASATDAQRKLTLGEMFAIFDQAQFPPDFFERKVHMPRKLDLF